jgi:hypothetical protein
VAIIDDTTGVKPADGGESMVTTAEWSEVEEMTPEVDAVREFLEISQDFASPLDLVREAISNSYDAKCSWVRLLFDVVKVSGKDVLKISIEDDGEGMGAVELKAFFDLGNSPGKTADRALIGEKGHGTKVYYNSDSIEVTTARNGELRKAIMKHPFSELHAGKIPKFRVLVRPNTDGYIGTRIELLGYNGNQRELFRHSIVKDHILWFTKHGSWELESGKEAYKENRLFLKGLDQTKEEEITFGHPFPPETASVGQLLKQHKDLAAKYLVKRWWREGVLPNYPEKKYQAVFYLEGDYAKRGANWMLGYQGRPRQPGSYTVGERYGLWLCKDFIPVERANEWISEKGWEWTRFHAFLNFQDFNLTANRGSVDNTPAEYLNDIEEVVRGLYEDIRDTPEWGEVERTQRDADADKTEKREQKEYAKRVKDAKSALVAYVDGHELIQPRNEQAVFGLFVRLQSLKPDIFPFDIVDYETRVGIDVLAKVRDGVDISRSELKYVEFKFGLTGDFNHTFEYLHSIVCWRSSINHGGEVKDVFGKAMKMFIRETAGRTEYWLEDPEKRKKIEVLVLEDYLKEILKLSFGPRKAGSGRGRK